MLLRSCLVHPSNNSLAMFFYLSGYFNLAYIHPLLLPKSQIPVTSSVQFHFPYRFFSVLEKKHAGKLLNHVITAGYKDE